LFCLGIIGEYVGKIYFETKRRPRFIISESLQPAQVVPVPYKAMATEELDRELQGPNRVWPF